eukprot:7298406-Prymnesium_polylepis.1
MESSAAFFYVGTPNISLPDPISGPQAGGTIVAFSGADLTNGSHYICLCEGTVVAASYDEPISSVRCMTPASTRNCDPFGRCLARTGRTECSVSLNGQQFSNKVPFEYHDVVHASVSTPSCGPVHGGTRVTVHGAGFGNSTSPLCRFGTAVVGAIVNQSADAVLTLRCTMPANLDEGTNVSLAVSLNGQQFSSQALDFYVHGAPTLSAIEPPLGPVLGGTRLSVRGAALGGGCDYTCAFDEVVTSCGFDDSQEA